MSITDGMYPAKIAVAGDDLNARWWSPTYLKEAVPLFRHARVFLRHQPKFGPLTSPVVGYAFGPRWVGDGDDGYIAAWITPKGDTLPSLLREAAQHWFPLALSLSVNAYQSQIPGTRIADTGRIKSVNSIDVVAVPAMPACQIFTDANYTSTLLQRGADDCLVQQMSEGGADVLPPRFIDQIADPAELRVVADTFQKLARMAR